MVRIRALVRCYCDNSHAKVAIPSKSFWHQTNLAFEVYPFGGPRPQDMGPGGVAKGVMQYIIVDVADGWLFCWRCPLNDDCS
jgi:hypothetical protein